MRTEKLSPFGPEALDLKKMGETPVEGIYRGKKSIATKMGDQTIWEFDSVEGEGFSVYGFTNLNQCMAQARVGDKLKLYYKGTKHLKTKFGMKDVHQAEVERIIDEDDDIKDPPLPV